MFFIYLILWLVFSMTMSVQIAAAGIVLSAAVYLFSISHLRHKHEDDVKLLRNFFRGLLYGLTLVWETAKANVMVFKIVFSRNIVIDPCLVYFKPGLKTNAARVALANSITLTPGTIVVALNDDLFCVHCLNREAAEDLEDSVFTRQLRKLED